MSPPKPQFHLARVYDDGRSEKPEIVPLAALPWDVRTRRRGLLGTGLAAGIVLVASRCGGKDEKPAPPAPDPVAQVSPEDACFGSDTSSVKALGFTDEGILVSGGSDGTVKVWGRSGDEVKDTLGRRDPGERIPAITALAVNPNGILVVTGDADGVVKVWDLPASNLITRIDRVGTEVTAIAASPDDRVLAWASEAGVWISETEVSEGRPLAGTEAGARSLTFTPDGVALAVGGSDGVVRLFTFPGAEPAGEFTGHTEPVQALAVPPAGDLLVSAGADGTIRLWTLPDGEEQTTLEIPTGTGVNALAIDSAGEILVSGDAQGFAQIWTFPEGALTTTLETNDGPVAALAISPTKGELVTGGKDQLTTWDLPSGQWRGCRVVLEAEPKAPPAPEPVDTAPSAPLPSTPPGGAPSPGIQPPVTPSVPGPVGAGGSICTCNQVCTCIPVSDRALKTRIRPLVAAPPVA